MAISKDNPYRKTLASLVNSIQKENRMEEEDCILLLHILDSEEKISLFGKWARRKMLDGHLEAKNSEITRAAVRISKGLEP